MYGPSPSARSSYGHHGLVGYGGVGSGSTGYLLGMSPLGSMSPLTTYGGTASGYGGLMVPSSASSSSLNRQPSPARHSSSNVLVGNLSIHPSGASSSSSYTTGRGRAGASQASSSSGTSQTSKQRARQRSRSQPRPASSRSSASASSSALPSPALSRSGSNTSLISNARSTVSEGYVVRLGSCGGA